MSVAFLEKHALELEDIQEKMSKMSQKKGKHGRHIGIVVISPSNVVNWQFNHQDCGFDVGKTIS